ncbi:MAG: hypothetical protein Kapaf2KO_15260 [Candidatus Kapaibacteriales bacterium]
MRHLFILIIITLPLISISQNNVTDNLTLPPLIRSFEYEPDIWFGVSYANGSSRGYYNTDGTNVLETTIDSSRYQAILDLPFVDVIGDFIDTVSRIDRADRLFESDYNEIVLSGGYSIGNFLIDVQLPITIRSVMDRYSLTEYDDELNQFNLPEVRAQSERTITSESITRIERTELTARYHYNVTDDFIIFTMPRATISLLRDDQEFFSEIPHELYMPLGLAYSVGNFNLLLEGGLNVVEAEYSEQFISNFTLLFSSVETTALFLSTNFVYSLDEREFDTNRPFEMPFAPSFFSVAPGFTINVEELVDLSFRYQVSLWNTNNLAVTNIILGANVFLE